MITRSPHAPSLPGRGVWLTAALVAALAAPAEAQPAPPARQVDVSVLVGFTSDAPRAFDSNPCAEDSWQRAATGRVHLSILRSVRLEAGVDILGGPGGPICQVDPAIPPENGEFVVSHYPARHVGYPVVQTGVRAAWTVVRGDAVEVRLTGGMERAWARGLWVPAAGVAVPIGRGGVRGLLELESLWYAIPRITRTTLFQNGAAVSSTTTETTVRTRSTRIRAGVLLPLP